MNGDVTEMTICGCLNEWLVYGLRVLTVGRPFSK